MLKPSYPKDNKKKKIKQIIIIKIDSITIINKKIIEYQKKKKSYLIFNNPLLQFSLMNISYIKPGPISLKKLTLIKPSIMLK